MNGKPLPLDAPEMKAFTTYIAFLSQGVPVGAQIEGAADLQQLGASHTATVLNDEKQRLMAEKRNADMAANKPRAAADPASAAAGKLGARRH